VQDKSALNNIDKSALGSTDQHIHIHDENKLNNILKLYEEGRCNNFSLPLDKYGEFFFLDQ
jgi:hypothetical protein